MPPADQNPAPATEDQNAAMPSGAAPAAAQTAPAPEEAWHQDAEQRRQN
jgi:hypothetical protein